MLGISCATGISEENMAFGFIVWLDTNTDADGHGLKLKMKRKYNIKYSVSVYET